MSIYDIVMLVIFFGSVLFGYRKGFAWQVASLASIIVSYFVAINFRNPVAQLISVEAPWNQFAAMLILFLGTSLIVWTVYASFNKSIKRAELKGFDRQTGALLGAFKGAILCMLVTVFAVSLFSSTRNMVHNSASGYYVVSGIQQFSRFTPTELAQFLDPHIQSFEQNIGSIPEKRPWFGDGTSAPDTQQSGNGFFNQAGFEARPTGQNGFSIGTNQTQQQYQGQFDNSTGGGQPSQYQNPNWNPPQNQNVQTSYPQNPAPNNGNWVQAQPNAQPNQPTRGSNYWNTSGTAAGNSQGVPAGQYQPRSTVTTGDNGWPQINTSIDTKELLQRGATTTADMLRRAYESANQPR